MHIHSPIFQGQLNEKKRLITFTGWALERVEKNAKKKGKKNVKNIFYLF